MANSKRPLSPHLQVYRLPMTANLSILHRATGVALSAGTLLFSYWLISATYGEAKFATAQSVMGSWFGQLVLWGFTFSLFYHLANGVRHLAWDAGWGFGLDKLRVSGWLVVLFAGGMTVLTLVLAYTVGG
jgi:succinate dehydrogenase / fumarate reductase cytochrome b subunit